MLFSICLVFLTIPALADESTLNVKVPEKLKEANLMQTGMTHLKNNRLTESRQAFSQAIAIDPDNSEAYITKGIVNTLLKDYQGAINDESKAIEIILSGFGDPKLAMAFNTRGHAYLASQELDLALSDFKLSQKLNPKFADNYTQLIKIYKAKGDLQTAQATQAELDKVSKK